MKMLAVSALLCALLVLTRATSPAKGENDPETEKPTESTPAPSAPAEGENDTETEKLIESTPPPSEEGPGAEELDVVTLPPTTVPTVIYDDFGFNDFGFNEYGFSCPDGWTMFDHARCLLYVPENMTWTHAGHNCWSVDSGHFYADLASVFEEHYFGEIQEVMQKAGHKSGQVWVGGSKASEDSSWSWTDFVSPNIFPNWCSEESQKGNCLKINFEENPSGCLEGSPCDAELPSVCSIILM